MHSGIILYNLNLGHFSNLSDLILGHSRKLSQIQTSEPSSAKFKWATSAHFGWRILGHFQVWPIVQPNSTFPCHGLFSCWSFKLCNVLVLASVEIISLVPILKIGHQVAYGGPKCIFESHETPNSSVENHGEYKWYFQKKEIADPSHPNGPLGPSGLKVA